MRRTTAEAAETRRQVLDAALFAFAEKGRDGATFDGIAQRVGLTRGAVHHHFRDKDDLLRTVVREHWAARGDVALAPLRATTRSASERLTSFVATYVHLLATDEGFRALATVTTLVAPREDSKTAAFPDDHRRSLDLWRNELRPVLGEPGALRAGVSVETAVFVIVNFMVGTTVAVAKEPGEFPATAACIAAAVLAGILAEQR